MGLSAILSSITPDRIVSVILLIAFAYAAVKVTASLGRAALSVASALCAIYYLDPGLYQKVIAYGTDLFHKLTAAIF